MITLTETAAQRAKQFLGEHQGAQGLRVGVRRSGCSGFAYVLDFAQEVGERDQVFEDHGVKIVVDRDSLDFLNGTELDFTREGLNSFFKFNNPNVKDSCGCGESFTV